MVYIDKKSFNICTTDSKYYDDPETGDLLELDIDRIAFECDDLIAPVISVLNRKGYNTEYCCQGHYHLGEFKKTEDEDGYTTESTGSYSYSYISFSNIYKNIRNNIPTGWELSFIPKDWRIGNKRVSEGKPIELNRKIPGVECNMILRFMKNMDLGVKRISKTKGNNEKDDYIIYTKFNEFISKEMSKLYMWAVSLPENKK